MKRMAALVGAVTLTFSNLAWAACTSHTFFVNGRYTTCTTCCYGNNCSTNCF